MNKLITSKLTFCGGILLTGALCGCSTLGGLAPGQGRKALVNETSYAIVWKAAKDCVARNLTIVESNEDKGSIKGETKVSMLTWGEVVGVFISRPSGSDARISVEVVSRRKMTANYPARDWESTIMDCVKDESAFIAGAAKALPAGAPPQIATPEIPESKPR